MARVSEKTIEINFCAQFRMASGRPAFWFGLTQEQEKRAGYDVMTSTPGRLLILQFKASAHVLNTGERQFHAPHHQLTALQDRLKGSRDILYVLPEFGLSSDLKKIGWDIVGHCWLLDVADIPSAIGPPTRRDGALRKTETHYLDLDATTGWVTIHSDPVRVRATKADSYAAERDVFSDTPSAGDRERLRFDSYDDFSRFAEAIGSKAVGYFLPD